MHHVSQFKKTKNRKKSNKIQSAKDERKQQFSHRGRSTCESHSMHELLEAFSIDLRLSLRVFLFSMEKHDSAG